MKRNFVVTWWLCLVTLSAKVLQEVSGVPEPIGVGVISGAHFQPMHKVTVYTSSVPLHFQTFWPRKLDSVNDPVNKHISCSNFNTKEVCSLQKEKKSLFLTIDSLLDLLNEASGEEIVTAVESKRTKRGITFLGEVANWCCDIATENQIQTLFNNEKDLAEHMEGISEQVLENHASLASLSNQVTVVNTAIAGLFGKVQSKFNNVSNFLKEFKIAIEESHSGVVQEFSQIHQVQLLSAALMAKQTHTLFRLDILNQCRAQKIPAVLVTPENLKLKLEHLERVINNDNYQLAIPVNEVQAYFHLKICTCQIFDEQLFVKIKIPIVQKYAEWKLYDFVAIPFSWKQSICLLHHEPTFLAVNGDEIRTIRGRELQDCRPFEDNLCYVPRMAGDAVIGALCPKAIFKGTTAEQLGQVCSFNCQVGNQLIISQVGPERYFLTNAKGKLELKCSLSKNETRYLHDDGQPGALDISVPCDCRLFLNEELCISETYPCDSHTANKFEILNVIPAAWSKIRKLRFPAHLTSKHALFPSLQDCLEEDWPSSIPHLNISYNTHVKENSKVLLETPIGFENFYVRHFQSISLGLVMIVLLIIIFKNPFLLGLGTIPRVEALSMESALHLEIGVTVVILILTIVFISCLCWRFFSLRREQREGTTEPSPNTSSSTSEDSVEVIIQQLRENRRVKASLKVSEESIIDVWLTL